jgi:hypothetical protein
MLMVRLLWRRLLISIQEEPEEERQPELKRRVRSHGKLPLDPGMPRSTPEPPARGR